MDVINEFAPAKLNLYLHVTGRRHDGYHDLDSLVAFASIGDAVSVRPDTKFSFSVDGPQAAALQGEDPAGNLVVLAARSLAALTGHDLKVAITLTKHLPVASGIGGGSSDAAAALRALARLWGLAQDDARIAEAAAQHGQDVPVCLKIAPLYMTAYGSVAAPVLPKLGVVLVNPNRALATPAVYKNFRENDDGFSPAAQLTLPPQSAGELVEAIKHRANDLAASACRLMPEIADILAALDANPECLLARMSGSGATCFGLYESETAAKTAAANLKVPNGGWWIAAGSIT